MNKKTKTKLFDITLIGLLLLSMFMFGACSKAGFKEKNSIDLSVFKSGDVYCYKGLEWGISKEDVEKELNISVGKTNAAYPFTYYTKEKLNLFGATGYQAFEFMDNKFSLVRYEFYEKNDDLGELCNKIIEELNNIYGKYEDEIEMKFGQSGTIYRWMNNNEDNSRTTLQVQKTVSQEKTTLVSISIAYMDPAPKED